MNNAILIVDDSLTVRGDLSDAFADAGLPTIACASVKEARAALASQQVGLIILDVILPDGDGVDLLKEIRATPVGAGIPVLMLSTEAEVRDRIRGLATGSNDYVGKPYDREYVVTRARELLDAGRRQEQQAPARTTVLVIDDSVTFREQISEVLRGQGYEVLIAASGEEGLRSAAVNRPAVVIVDGVLPGIDGPTVVRKLRLDVALRDTPCILLTGSVDRSAELHALDAGADAFLSKEEDLGMILARVSAVLRNAGGAGFERETASLLSSKKILAVDDSPTYLQELGATLRGEGYDVILARSGEEALDMIAVQPVDCILLDRLMPGLGGTETCRRIKASPALRDIPLIMLTAMEDREAMIEGLSTGADDYVLKSNELDVLKARVRAQLRRKQFEDESRRIRSELMSKELEATEARAARELAESRAELLAILEQKNVDLETANAALHDRQREIAEKNEQLEQVNRLKSEFLSNMSHELRTPLNAIIGFSEILKDGVAGALSERQKEFITQVFSSGHHLLALINDILDLSKVEAGKMALELEPIALNELLKACLDIVKEHALKRGIALSFDACPGNDCIAADRRKLKQIVYNLLSNAVKYTPDGGAVSLSAHAKKRGELWPPPPQGMATRLLPLPPGEFEDFLEIRVHDTGIGISSEDLPQLFQSFLQLNSSMSRQHQGTGLGLALVSRMAELHGGAVGVSSAPGKGSHFSVCLPWRKADSIKHS